MAGVGRPPGQTGRPKTGGRVKGSLDKQARQIVTDEIANDIIRVYAKLGGQKFLLEWAKANPAEFVRQCLGRLMPAFPKDGPDSVQNTQVNIGATSEFEAGRRIAYLLASAAAKLDLEHEQPVQRQVEQDPLQVLDPPVPPARPEIGQNYPGAPEVFGFAHSSYESWCADLKKTDAERAVEAEQYGSSAEQGVGGLRSGVSTEPPTTVAGRLRGRRR